MTSRLSRSRQQLRRRFGTIFGTLAAAFAGKTKRAFGQIPERSMGQLTSTSIIAGVSVLVIGSVMVGVHKAGTMVDKEGLEEARLVDQASPRGGDHMEDGPMKRLEGMPQDYHGDQVRCLKACLDYLGVAVSLPWLYGGTAHAFVLIMNADTDPDCEFVWDTTPFRALYPNLGFRVDGVTHVPPRGDDDSPGIFRQKQREAWDFTRARIDRGIPCLGWQVSHLPMYYLITGCDDVGYVFSDRAEQGPCPWEDLGTDVGGVEVFSVERHPPAGDDVVVRDALTAVLDRVERADGWGLLPQPQYRTGLPAYDVWAEALEKGTAGRASHSYLTRYLWRDRRDMAVQFLI